jgi:large subunit ribosomal protein L10
MIGEIIGLLQSPIQRVVSALQNKSETVEATAEEAAPAVEETPAAEAPEAPAAESTDETPAAE